MKVCFNSREEAQTCIGMAKTLKNSAEYGKVFIAPDRSPEERAHRRKLVQLLREKKDKQPEMHHYISRGEVCTTERYIESVPLPATTLQDIMSRPMSASGLKELQAFQQRFFKRLSEM